MPSSAAGVRGGRSQGRRSPPGLELATQDASRACRGARWHFQDLPPNTDSELDCISRIFPRRRRRSIACQSRRPGTSLRIVLVETRVRPLAERAARNGTATAMEGTMKRLVLLVLFGVA